LNTAIASVALPYITGSLSASNSEATWVLTSYLVANAVILPAGQPSIRFARRCGRKRFLLICVIIFTVASFFCGAAPSLVVILLTRVLQGAGGGALQPLSQSILLESFPIQKRAMAMAAYGLGIVIAAVLGPTLGGWLTNTFSWRYAFYINIPVGILAVFMIAPCDRRLTQLNSFTSVDTGIPRDPTPQAVPESICRQSVGHPDLAKPLQTN
jgi:DHA2 family multidrug resistance protein